MAHIVTLPNGEKEEFPDEATPQMMKEALSKKYPHYFNESSKINANSAENIQKDHLKESSNPLSSIAQGFGKETGDIAQGLGRLLNKVGLSPEYDIAKKLGAISESNTYKPENAYENAGAIGADIGSAFLGGGGKNLSLIQNILKNISENSILGASRSPDAEGTGAAEGGAIGAGAGLLNAVMGGAKNTFTKALARGLTGAGIGAVGGEISGFGPGEGALYGAGIGVGLPKAQQVLGFGSKRAAREIFEGINPEDVSERLEASRRLGLPYLTPSEASGNSFTSRKEGSLWQSPEGAKELTAAGKERMNAERNAIQDLHSTIYNEPKDSPKVSNLYGKAYEASMPLKDFESLKDNEVFKSALSRVKKRPAYKEELKGIPENNFEYLDKVKQALDDMSEELSRKGSKSERRIINQTNASLKSKMDRINPVYESARNLSQRQIISEKLDNALNEADVIGTSFYDKVLKNDVKFDKLYNSLEKVPEAQQKLKDMRLVFKDLINPVTPRTAAGQAKTSMSFERSGPQWIANHLKELAGGKFDEAQRKIITSPDWDKDLQKISSIRNKEAKARAYINLLSKITTLSNIQNTNPQMSGFYNKLGTELSRNMQEGNK